MPIVLFALACASVWLLQPASAQTKALVITNVTIVDVVRETIQPRMNVVVGGGRIAALAPARAVRVPRGAQVVDATGKFLIPGLWDLHVHTQLGIDQFARLFVAHGVTGVRDMGSDFDSIDRFRRHLADGTLPRLGLVATGPILDDAPADWPLRLKIHTADEGRNAVRLIKSRGMDWVKVHNSLPRDAYFAIVKEAAAQGLSVGGHVPVSVTIAEAVAAGQKTIEHFSEFRIVNDCAREERCEALIRSFIEHGTWQVPTLVALRVITGMADVSPDRAKYVSPAVREFWMQMDDMFFSKRSKEQTDRMRDLYRRALPLVGRMHRAGVRLAAATDTSLNTVLPGFSLHDELALFVESGLSPAAALKLATSDAAALLGKSDDVGTIEKGKRANLVILAGNPLQDIRLTTKIDAVVLDGTLFDRAALDGMLAKAEGR